MERRGEIRSVGHLYVRPCDELDEGEIICKEMDPALDVECTECGHIDFWHDGDNVACYHGRYRDETGWLCLPCNCGNHTGR